MLGKNEKPSFPLKNIYVYNLWYLAVSKTLNIHDGVILTLSFPANYYFLNCIPFLCLLSKECFVLNENLRCPKPLNIYQCHLPSTRKETFLCSACLELFLARSSLFKLTMACYWLFHFLQASTSQNVLSHKFTSLTQLLQRSASVIIKCDSFFELQSEARWLHIGAIFITRWDNNHSFIK